MDPVAPLRDPSPADARGAIRANWAALYLDLGRAPGAELSVDEHLSWVLTGLPDAFLNVVFRTDLPRDHAGDVVDRAIAHFRDRRIPVVSWLTAGPEADRLLVSRGLTFERGGTGMAADLADLPPSVPAPPGLTILEVESRSDLRQWVPVMRIGFGMAEDAEPRLLDLIAAVVSLPRTRTFLGLLDGRPVATSQLFMAAGVAGIYNVTCLPEARGRGIGGAVTLAALLEARRRGYEIAILQASDLGYPVYRRLGFRDHGRLNEYRFTLDEGSTAATGDHDAQPRRA